MMRDAKLSFAATGLLVLALLLHSGCGGPAPGLRWAPPEELKQSGQIGADLAGYAETTGLPPTSPAAIAMAKAVRNAATHLGRPKEPVNIEHFVPEGVRDAWATHEKRFDAVKLRERIQSETTRLITGCLANLAATIEDRPEIPAEEFVFRVQGLVDAAAITTEVAAAIAIPAEPGVSEADAQLMQALTEATDTLNAAAARQAARRPTVEEAVDQTLEAADTTIAKIGGILENYGLLALIPGGAGVVYGARRRKQQKAAQAERDTAKHEAQNLARSTEMARQESQDVVTRAMEHLAAAAPPPAARPAPDLTDLSTK